MISVERQYQNDIDDLTKERDALLGEVESYQHQAQAEYAKREALDAEIERLREVLRQNEKAFEVVESATATTVIDYFRRHVDGYDVIFEVARDGDWKR